MLPSELLIRKVSKDRIYPCFVTDNTKELAEEIISLYKNFVGKKKGEIDEIFEDFEQGLNFKLVRGLRTLLERRCVFESKFVIEPALARRAVFEEASDKKITERRKVIENAAKKLNVSVSDLGKSLWADQESEVVFEQFESLNPEELLKLYNLSLAQTLLFKSTGMTVSIKGNYKDFFRAIKYLGLMYIAEADGGVKVRIEGALSLLKLSEKYGTSLAKLLPVIVSCDEWGIDAEVVIRRDTPRIYHFVMDSRDKDLLACATGKVEKVSFDSSVEEKFYTEFLSATESWDLIREPDAIFTPRGVFIPDFKFRHKEMGMEVYFEIVGFWTEDYLRRKMAKLRGLPNILLAVDKNLACSGFKEQLVILFNKRVPVGEVLRYLTGIEEKEIEKQKEKLKGVKIELEGDIIPIKDIAEKYGVSREALDLNNPDYVVFKDVVVRKEVLNKVKDKLLTNSYLEAREIIKSEGLPNPDEVLFKLGFKIKWKGLDPSAAAIEATSLIKR